ncbi:MAG: dephospho-CoA kinase [Candidatus Eremiobacteraeota bacterium]|nr:dephospho-CoA kinase [Candidatus Eremiobacteraeota bacterium]
MILGITGGIASGKSLVASWLEEWGAPVVDADKVYRDLIEPGRPLCEKIIAEWGTGILDGEGRIDRSALGRQVFSDPAMRERLDGITHPAIIGELKERLSFIKSEVVVLMAPLLIEAGQRSLVDRLWLVALSEEEQVRRLVARDGLGAEEALRRVKCQLSLEEKKLHADAVIDNGGTPDTTRRMVRKLWDEMKERLALTLRDDHYCFACGADNPVSLRLSFSHDEKGLSGTFTTRREHQGYKGLLHGGIITTMLDEAMARYLIDKGHRVVTVKMELRFRRPALTGDTLTVKAAYEGLEGKYHLMSAKVLSSAGSLLVQARGTFAEREAS